MSGDDAEIVRRIRDLPAPDPPDGWEERAVERFRRERRRRRRILVVVHLVAWVLGAIVAAAILATRHS